MKIKYRKIHDLWGLEVGDTVKVVRQQTNKERNKYDWDWWGTYLTAAYVNNRTFLITGIRYNSYGSRPIGFILNNGCFFPVYVLRKVK